MAIGWSEYLVLAVVVLLVFGPKELPAAGRSLGRFLRQVRRFSSDARRTFEQVLRDVERAAEPEHERPAGAADPRQRPAESPAPQATAATPAAPDPSGSI